VVIENSFFVNLNYMGRAAIAFAGSRAAVVNSSFISCNNSAAGALYGNDSAIIKVLDSTFTNNGGGQGGAITVHNATLIVNGTTFLNNTSRGEGGAIAGTNVTVLQVMESTLMYNTAKVGAGGGSGVVGGLGGGVVGVLAQPKQLPLEHLQVSPEPPHSTSCPCLV
jgi:predicted outer membrane repeat protein